MGATVNGDVTCGQHRHDVPSDLSPSGEEVPRGGVEPGW